MPATLAATKRVEDGELLAQASGPMEISLDERGSFGDSAVLDPEDLTLPSWELARADDAREAAVQHELTSFDRESRKAHPLADPAKRQEFDVRILVKGADGKLAERKPVFRENDAYIPLHKGEDYEIQVRHNRKERVLLRLLVDGLNTMFEEDTGGPGERIDQAQVTEPGKGIVRRIIGKRVALEEARPWVLDPESLAGTGQSYWSIRGFVSKLGADGAVRQFTVVDGAESLAAQRQFSPRAREVLESLPRKATWVVTAKRSQKHPAGDGQISERRLLEYLKRVLTRLGLLGHLHKVFSPLKYSTGCVIAGMRSQNSDVSRFSASREQLRCELGEVEISHDGLFQQAVRQRFVSNALLAGIPETVVRECVGHLCRDTLKIYTTVFRGASQAAMDRMAQSFGQDSRLSAARVENRLLAGPGQAHCQHTRGETTDGVNTTRCTNST